MKKSLKTKLKMKVNTISRENTKTKYTFKIFINF